MVLYVNSPYARLFNQLLETQKVRFPTSNLKNMAVMKFHKLGKGSSSSSPTIFQKKTYFLGWNWNKIKTKKTTRYSWHKLRTKSTWVDLVSLIVEFFVVMSWLYWKKWIHLGPHQRSGGKTEARSVETTSSFSQVRLSVNCLVPKCHAHIMLHGTGIWIPTWTA